MERRLYIPRQHSPEYKAAREAVNAPSLETAKPIIYESGKPERWHAFNESLRTFPERKHVAPWKSKDPEQIRIEAMQRGYLIDKSPDILRDVAKRKWNPRYNPDFFEENPDLIPRYVNVFDRPQFQTGYEFPWRTDGAFVIGANRKATRETIYSGTVDEDRRLITPDDFEEFGKLHVGIKGGGVGSSDGDALLELGVENIKMIDGGKTEMHDFRSLPNAGLPRIGMNHAEHWAWRAYEMYPHGKFEYIKQNVGDGTNGTYPREEFLDGLDLVIEVIDNLPEKIRSREAARARGIPVFMTTDLLMGADMMYQPGVPDAEIFPNLSEENRRRVLAGEKMKFVEVSDIAHELVGPDADYWSAGARRGRGNWSQNGAQAATSKVALAKTLRRFVRGQDIPHRKGFLLDDY